MPPESYARAYSQPKQIPVRKQKPGVIIENHSPRQRKKCRGSPKSNSRNSPRNQRKPAATHACKQTISYGRDELLSLRNCPTSTTPPDLPAIPGVTVPRTKENKEIPLSLKLKLQRKGIEVKELNNHAMTSQSHDRDVLKPILANQQSKSRHRPDDVIWQSCMYHVV